MAVFEVTLVSLYLSQSTSHDPFIGTTQFVFGRFAGKTIQKCIFCLKKLYGPFLWIGFNCLKVTEPLQGDILLFTTKNLGIPGTHFINLRRTKGWVNLRTTQWFQTQDPWTGKPEPQPLDH